MPAMVMFFGGFGHGNHAAMRHFADHVLELDRRVVDAEFVEQSVFHIPQDSFAYRGRDVSNRDMAGECMGF